MLSNLHFYRTKIKNLLALWVFHFEKCLCIFSIVTKFLIVVNIVHLKYSFVLLSLVSLDMERKTTTHGQKLLGKKRFISVYR